MDVVASIQHAIEVANKLRALSKTIENADFKMLLADLSSDLADAKLEVAELKSKLAKAHEENQALSAQLDRRTASKPIPEEGGYRFEGEDGLFCTGCYDGHEKRIRLAPVTGHFAVFGKWKCPACSNHFS